MTDVAKAAEIFLDNIEDGLGERHEVCREAEEWGDRRVEDISGIQIEGVDNEFHEVEGGYGKRVECWFSGKRDDRTDTDPARWGSRRPLVGPSHHRPIAYGRRRQRLKPGRVRSERLKERTHIIDLLVDFIASPDPVEVPTQHGSRAVERGSTRGNKMNKKDPTGRGYSMHPRG